MTEQAKNIYQRLNAVMKEVKYVQKDKEVDAPGQRYKAVTHDQVVSVARESMVKHGIVIVPKQVSGGLEIKRDLEKGVKMHLYSGAYKILFVNIDNPDDFVSATVQAHAADNGDKAPGKCLTYATKTAVVKVLWLETGEDEESREEVRESQKPITEEQAATIKKRLEATESDVNKFLSVFKVQSVDSIPAKMYPAVDQALTKKETNNGAG